MRQKQEDPPRAQRRSREHFLARLTKWARDKCGVVVSDRMLGDWLEERLLAEPKKTSLGYGKGSSAHWDAETYRRACRICRFKKGGAKSHDEVRILLWISGEYVSFKDLRESCLSELHRHKSSAAFSTRSNVDLNDPMPAKRTVKAFEKKGSAVDRQLVPIGFNYDGRDILNMLAMLKTGKADYSFARSLFDAMGIESDVGQVGEFVGDLFQGLLGEDDEISSTGETALEAAELSHFRLARSALQEIVDTLRILSGWMNRQDNLRHSQLSTAIARSHGALMQPNFRILNFIALVAAIQKGNWPPNITTKIENN